MGQNCTAACTRGDKENVCTEVDMNPSAQHEVLDDDDGPDVVYASSGDWRGTYRPEFVNGMLQAVWPSVEGFSKEILQKNIIPGVRRAMGSLGSSFHVDFDTYKLGERPPRFSRMVVSEGHQIGENDERLRVMNVRTKMSWEGDINVYASFKGIKCGVTQVTISGDMIMELVGSSPRPPLFEGARGCFINPPSIKVEYDVGMLSSLASVGPIDTSVHKVLDEKVREQLVIPNRMGVRFDPNCEMFRILKPRPLGLLHLTFHRAEGLPAMDTGIFNKATSDPLIKVKCGAMVFTSHVVEKSLNPVFGWTATLPIDLPRDQLVNIEVWDKDTFTGDDFMGCVRDINVEQLIIESGRELCYHLSGEDNNKTDAGKLFVTAEWRPLMVVKTDSDVTKMLNAEKAVVFAGVYFANRLPDISEDTKYWVTLQCTNRLGIGGHDITRARCSPRKRVDNLIAPLDVDTAAEKKRFERRKALAKKYNISQEDMALLLEVDPARLDDTLTDPGSYGKGEARWNYAAEFFISDLKEATLTMSLHTNSASMVGSRTRGSGGIIHAITTGGTEDIVMHTWEVKVRDLIATDNDPRRIFEVKGGQTSVHTRLQVRCLGPPRKTVS